VLRFSIKDLLLSMALVALGLGAIMFTFTLDFPWKSLDAYGLVLTGAGIGCLSYIVLVIVPIALYHY
jgi:hypothetical protein